MTVVADGRVRSPRVLLVSIVALVAIGLYEANTLTRPEWAVRLHLEETDIRLGSRSATSFPAIGWLHAFTLSDFSEPRDVWVFLRDLQVPIPPLLAVAEVLTHLSFGSVAPITIGVYQFAFVGSFVLALVLCRRSRLALMLSFTLSVVLLTGAIESHRLNPQIYDVVCPFFLLLFVVALDLFQSARGPAARSALAALCGLALALAELSRPFMIYLVPFLALVAGDVMRRGRSLLCFLVPLLLLSGVWHAHVAIRYQRLAWSNHAGFNLRRAWPMVEAPELLKEDAPSLKPERANINTNVHGENSRRLSRAVFFYVATHPLRASAHLLGRVYELVFQTPPLYRVVGVREAYYPLYRAVVCLCGIWWLLCVAAFCARSVRLRTLGRPAVSAALVIAASGSIILLAAGDKGEEFRFLVTVLPLFAALPACSLQR